MRKILSIGLSILSAFTMIISTSSCAVKDWTNQLFCEHEFGQEVITRESTCSKEGEVTKTCKLCGYKDKQAIDKTPHIELYVESKEATCIEKGHTDFVKCKVCGEVIVAAVDIPMTGHKIVTDKGVKATCLTSGITDGEHCETCGKVFKKQTKIVATGHSLVVVEGRASTCTTTGLSAGVKCEYCNEFFTEQVELPKLEHVDSNSDLLCDHCDLYINLDREKVLATAGNNFTGTWFRLSLGESSGFTRFKSLPTNIEVECDLNFFEVNIGHSRNEFYISFLDEHCSPKLKNLNYYLGDGFIDFYIESKTYDLESNGEVVGTITFNEDTLIPSDFVQSADYAYTIYKLI